MGQVLIKVEKTTKVHIRQIEERSYEMFSGMILTQCFWKKTRPKTALTSQKILTLAVQKETRTKKPDINLFGKQRNEKTLFPILNTDHRQNFLKNIQ